MTRQLNGSRISHYRIAGELGRDRLGFVLRAVDEMLDRPVALKVVRIADAFPAEQVTAVRERFKRDAQRAARLQHQALVTIYGFEQIGAADVIAMELVEGETLKARLARGERWRALDAAALVARIADALAVAHARQLVHGHLSLANVKLTADGRVKLLDLGIPKAAAAELAAYAAGEDAPAATMQDDVAALGRITCHLITGAFRRPADGGEDDSLEPTFPEPSRVLANFGVLAPILARALSPAESKRFADAGEFRDALVDVVRGVRDRQPAGQARERGGYHPPAGDVRRPARPQPQTPVLDTDGALGPLEKFSGERAGPALVLPPDLAGRGEPPPSGSFVVMDEASPFERVRMAAADTAGRFGDFPWGRFAAVLTVLVIIATGVLVQRRLARGDASAATLRGGDEPPAATAALAIEPRPAGPPLVTDSAGPADSAGLPDSTAPPEAAPPPIETPSASGARTAVVAATPAGTAITVQGASDRGWLDRTELSVPEGDSIVLRFVRRGYVPATRVFRGEPLAVALEPDSVFVRFQANLPAEVLVRSSAAESAELHSIGNTGSTVRLPTGTYTVVYRVASQQDWTTTGRFPTAGNTYTISKMDYATHGGFVATVAGGWALVSIDGGDEHETPFRFSELTAGRHVVRLRRDGFQTIVDTITVRGGEVATRQYSLTPSR